MNIGDTAKLNTNPGDSPETTIRLFVYGTLKRGYWNHQRFCAQARNIEPAVVWGRLYHFHAGFPAIEVPEGLILARGSADPLTDARRQQEIGTPRFGRPTGDWDLVHGEMMTFANPGFDLPPIDLLEAFDPNGRCVYTRVLVAVEANDLIRPVWLYHYKIGHNMERIASGSWYQA